MEQECTRREFFVGAAKVVAVMGIAAVIMSPAEIFAKSKKSKKAKELEVDLSVKENKPLTEVGGALMLDNPNEKKAKIILYRNSETEILAFSSKCTHVKGPVGLPDKDGKMVCKWHNAEFNLEGEAIKGPAKKPLKKFVCLLDKETVTVTL